jgi:hypothetical protein
MRAAGAAPILAGVTVIVIVAVVAAVVVFDPVGSVVRGLDLPAVSDLPDLPRWLWWALGKVKFVVIGVVALVVVVRELRRSRGA